MRKTHMLAVILLLSLSVLCLTACGSSENNTTQSTTGAQSQSGSQSSTSGSSESSGGAGSGTTNGTGGAGVSGSMGESGSAGGNTNSSGNTESSTGVIDGLLDDVEEGVEDLTGSGAARASDESK